MAQAIDSLREQLVIANGRAERADRRIDEERGRVDRAERLLEEEQKRNGELQASLADAVGAERIAHDEAAALRAELDRRGIGASCADSAGQLPRCPPSERRHRLDGFECGRAFAAGDRLVVVALDITEGQRARRKVGTDLVDHLVVIDQRRRDPSDAARRRQVAQHDLTGAELAHRFD
jgi:hypothetical protein